MARATPPVLAALILGLLAAGVVLAGVRLTDVGGVKAAAPVAARGPGSAVTPTTGPAVAPSAAAEPVAVASAEPVVDAEPRVITYRVEVRSPDPVLADAAAVVTAVLEDPRGWQQAGIDLQERPDATNLIVIAEGEEAQQLCQPYDVGGRFSCQNGPLVVLNAIRWREAVPHWPGDVESYRTMLVNHEVGHLLGMHHLRCPGPGLVAPVMEQQSGSLDGCIANPWPTAIELRLAATGQFRIAPGPLDVPYEP